MSAQTAIRTEGLTKHYGRVRALEDLNLDIPRGEVCGFLGPNGAGKTTTIRTLMDEIRATAGRASILGMDTHQKSVEIRRHIGYLPGDLAMYPNLTGRETITYFANLRGGVDWSYVDRLAERLQSDLDKKVGDLSSGNRQKVGIIRHGRLVAAETIPGLRSRAMRHVDLILDSPGEASVFQAVPGVRDVKVTGRHVAMSFHGETGPLLRAVAGRCTIVDISTQEADLEEIFLTCYREDEKGT